MDKIRRLPLLTFPSGNTSCLTDILIQGLQFFMTWSKYADCDFRLSKLHPCSRSMTKEGLNPETVSKLVFQEQGQQLNSLFFSQYRFPSIYLVLDFLTNLLWVNKSSLQSAEYILLWVERVILSEQTTNRGIDVYRLADLNLNTSLWLSAVHFNPVIGENHLKSVFIA